MMGELKEKDTLDQHEGFKEGEETWRSGSTRREPPVSCSALQKAKLEDFSPLAAYDVQLATF